MTLVQQLPLFTNNNPGYEVKAVSPKDTHYLLLNVHYARRIPAISHAFGLFHDGNLVGVVTYGMPASWALCKGLCGEIWSQSVLELNRLVLVHNLPNEASRLVGNSLKMLPKPRIVVSYADSHQAHLGVVYQATNFLYTGLTAKRTEWAVRGKEHQHSKTLSRGKTLAEMKETYGEDFYYRDRSQKHRYVLFLGSRTEVKRMRSALRYPIRPYPKEAL